MAELNRSLAPNDLPLEPSVFSNKGNDIINGIVNNDFLKSSNSKILSEDIKNLKERKKRESLRDIITSLEVGDDEDNENKTSGKVKLQLKEQKLTNLENIELFKLQEKYLKSKYDEVISEIDTILISGKDIGKKFKIELLKIKARSYGIRGYVNDSLKCYKEIEKIEGSSIENYISQINISNNTERKIELSNELLSLDPYFYRSYNIKADLLISKYNTIISNEKKPSHQEIISILDEGIKRNPSLINNCYISKFNFILNDKENKTNIEDCEKQLIF